MNSAASYDFAPLLRLALFGLVLASAPLAWVWLRHRGGNAAQRQRALTLWVLFLSFAGAVENSGGKPVSLQPTVKTLTLNKLCAAVSIVALYFTT